MYQLYSSHWAESDKNTEIFSLKKKKSKKTKQKDKKKRNNNKPRVKISSLTCLFVYKVLNQEVLDDRGKFEVSLTLKKWVLKSWRQDIRRHVYLAHIIKNLKVFSVACDKEYDLQFISGWEVSSLEENFKRSVMQVRRQSSWSSDPPTGTDESFGWGWKTGPTCFRKYSRNIEIFHNRDERKVLPDLYTDHILYQLICLSRATLFAG